MKSSTDAKGQCCPLLLLILVFHSLLLLTTEGYKISSLLVSKQTKNLHLSWCLFILLLVQNVVQRKEKADCDHGSSEIAHEG